MDNNTQDNRAQDNNTRNLYSNDGNNVPVFFKRIGDTIKMYRTAGDMELGENEVESFDLPIPKAPGASS